MVVGIVFLILDIFSLVKAINARNAQNTSESESKLESLTDEEAQSAAKFHCECGY